jgi:RNA polymerase sigma-70 factor (ECF subfamily)
MSGNPTLAEELVQESFVRAWQKLGSFRGSSAFSTWLHRLTVNVVLGHQRSTDRRETRVSGQIGDTAADSLAPTAHPGQTIDLERAIRGLPEGARRVFILHDVEGFRHREISRLTGIAVGTSKAQLHRARKLLRKVLEP